ncbi:hypothetical protein SK224_00110 [Microbacterium sp. BG28]|uniref:hypothetical protein n=1 Tax=Microbacterium sp. BG28 TaxID=3097356 RepID=UPI002A5A8F80|nr:hypothetical protein [Microbacterium sp. BG28]MDY0827522.1 hypothetical protein [Microbacterium sp. BG28]
MPGAVRVLWTTRDGADRRTAAARLVRDATGRTLRHGPCPRCGGDHGRPRLEGGGSVSLAYAGDLVVTALAEHGDIGVDVEQGAASAPARLDRLAPGSMLRDWTRFEAATKAVGADLRDGIQLPVVIEDEDWVAVVAGRVVHGREVDAPAGFVISVARAGAAEPGRSTS